MPKTAPLACLHEPLSVVLGTRAKLVVLRILGRALTPLPIREVARRSGMAYRSIDLALSDLIAVGVVEELAGGRERRVRTCSGHRLAPVIAGLLRAEADFFPSLRTELKAIAAAGEKDGLLALALVGATTRREERLGEAVEVVLVGSDAPTADRWMERYQSAADALTKRFGVEFHFTGYDLGQVRALWRTATAPVLSTLRSAESLSGASLLDLVEGHSP
jgi:hypothetical protein